MATEPTGQNSPSHLDGLGPDQLTGVSRVSIRNSEFNLVSPELVRSAIQQAWEPEAHPEAARFVEKLRVFYFEQYSLRFPSQSDALNLFLDGFSQVQCAEAAGVQPPAVSKWVSKFLKGAQVWLREMANRDVRWYWAAFYCARTHGFGGSGSGMRANTCLGCRYRADYAKDDNTWQDAVT